MKEDLYLELLMFNNENVSMYIKRYVVCWENIIYD